MGATVTAKREVGVSMLLVNMGCVLRWPAVSSLEGIVPVVSGFVPERLGRMMTVPMEGITLVTIGRAGVAGASTLDPRNKVLKPLSADAMCTAGSGVGTGEPLTWRPVSKREQICMVGERGRAKMEIPGAVSGFPDRRRPLNNQYLGSSINCPLRLSHLPQSSPGGVGSGDGEGRRVGSIQDKLPSARDWHAWARPKREPSRRGFVSPFLRNRWNGGLSRGSRREYVTDLE